ncbi:MAG: asparagine synthase-related protein, partial [Brevundimonas sp.]
AVAETAAGRGARVLLTGELGNATLSWAGLEVFPELISQGRWREAWRLWRAWTASGEVGVRAAALTVAGAWAPTGLWGAVRRVRAGRDQSLRHSALNPDRVQAMDLATRARDAGLDLHYRLRRDGFAARMWHLGWVDPGVFRKAALAAWGVDIRDPTSDRRLVEFCLTLPAESFFRNGRPRALAREVLADRAPAAVLAERRRGYQAADWAVALSAARGEARRMLERAGRGSGAAMLDMPRLQALVERWPQPHEWGTPEATSDYRQALLRGLAVAAFLEAADGPLGPNLDSE